MEKKLFSMFAVAMMACAFAGAGTVWNLRNTANTADIITVDDSGNLGVTGTVIVASSSTTGAVSAASYKIGTTAGFTGVITNGIGTAGATNRVFYSGGIVTNVLVP